MIEMLYALRAELTQDLMYCQTRDAHIRLAQRISHLDWIILQSSSETDTPSEYDTVLP
jgi:hypothetical protein